MKRERERERDVDVGDEHKTGKGKRKGHGQVIFGAGIKRGVFLAGFSDKIDE